MVRPWSVAIKSRAAQTLRPSSPRKSNGIIPHLQMHVVSMQRCLRHLLQSNPSSRRKIAARPFHWRRIVRHDELDMTAQVQMAAYFNWLEEAFFRAVRVAGWPLER